MHQAQIVAIVAVANKIRRDGRQRWRRVSNHGLDSLTVQLAAAGTAFMVLA